MNTNMRKLRKLVMMLAALLAMAGFAGCLDAGEEEAVGDEGLGADEGVQDEPLTDDENLGEDDEVFGENDVQNEWVTINGALYQCDTFLELTDAAENTCDEYQLADDQEDAAGADAEAFQADEQGIVTINGQAYECDDELATGEDEGVADDGVADEGVAEDEGVFEEQPCEEYVLVQSSE